MKKSSLTIIAAELRTRRITAGLKPSQIDQAAYIYESAANLDRLNETQIQSARNEHAAAIQRALNLKAPRAVIA